MRKHVKMNRYAPALVIASFLFGACVSQVQPDPTAPQRTAIGEPSGPSATAPASAIPIGRADVPLQTRRSVDIGGRSLVLEPHVWRDMSLSMDPPETRGALFSGMIRSTSGSVPDTVKLL